MNLDTADRCENRNRNKYNKLNSKLTARSQNHTKNDLDIAA